jgi:hypothetical protein
VLSVYAGAALNSLSLVACNEDISSVIKQSQATFTAAANTIYYVQVGGYGASVGTAVVTFN